MRVDGWKIVLGSATVMLSANLFFGAWGVGLIGALGFFLAAIVLISRMDVLGRDVWERLVYGTFAVVGGTVVLLDGMYLVLGRFDVWMVLMALWLVAGALFLFGNGAMMRIRVERGPKLFAWISVLASVMLIGMMWMARTDIPLVSPWNLFGLEPFMLLTVALIAAMLCAAEREDDLPLFVWMLVAFSMLSVSAIVYAVGFGFDPFLHRAAEVALVHTGVVEPVRLLYSGQYVFVAAVHHLTGWPIKLIDMWLVPVLASLWLPVIASLGFERGWGVSRSASRMWWVGILVIPFMLATFTVPFTVSYVFFLGVMVAYPYFLRASLLQFVTVLFALLGVALFHPLLSVPLGIFLLGGRLMYWCKNRWTRMLAAIGTMGMIGWSVPMMLALSGQGGSGVWERSRLTTHIGNFVRLFLSPYWDPYPYIPWMLDALYEYRYWMPMMASVLAILCVLLIRSLRTKALLHLTFCVGMLLSILGASTLFVFEGIIEHEQGEFALRLLQCLFTFALPPLVVLWARWHRVVFLRVVMVALLVVIAWFFSYPQYNLKYPFFSPSVSAADVRAVHEIDALSAGAPYLVLSHQLMSAAAIQEFGFIHTYPFENSQILWYAIPTGGPLYALYIDTIFHGPSKDAYAYMAQQTGAERIYFAAPAYWAWSPELIGQLETDADNVIRIDGITIYEFIPK